MNGIVPLLWCCMALCTMAGLLLVVCPDSAVATLTDVQPLTDSLFPPHPPHPSSLFTLSCAAHHPSRYLNVPGRFFVRILGLAILGLAMASLALLDARSAVADAAARAAAAKPTSSKGSSSSGNSTRHRQSGSNIALTLDQLRREVDGGIGGALCYGGCMGILGLLLAILASWGNHRLPPVPSSLLPHIVWRTIDSVSRSPFLPGRLAVFAVLPMLVAAVGGAVVAAWPRSPPSDAPRRDTKHAKVD